MEEVGHRFKISNVEGKGVGWITTKNIQRGEKIWTESPILNSIGQFALLGTINKAVNGIVKLNKLALNVPGTASFQQCQVTLHLINKGQKKGIGAIYGLKPIKCHSFLNIWLQTRLQTRLQTHWL